MHLKSCPFCSTELVLIAIGGKDRQACSSCEFVHWNNPNPVTATIVPIDDGIVLVKRKFEPFVDDWCLPGGFIEAAEHPAHSAVREVQEETGLNVEIVRILDAAAPGRGINVIILFYEARLLSGELLPGDDASEVGVFRRDELPGNIAFDLHRRIIKQWFESSI